MAPWPEVGDRKASDKEESNNIEELPKVEVDSTTETELGARNDQVTKPEEKEVLTLDEGQLKALLDEAITYKNPKDREGKSELFKELLQEAEADESNSEGLGSSLTGGKLPRSYYNLPQKKRYGRQQGRECGVGVGVSVSRGGSLQNLHALGMEGGRGARSRRNGRSNETLVSARQREGGSLPSNVNVDDIGSDSMICPNYTSQATFQVSDATNLECNVSIQQIASIPNGLEPLSAFSLSNVEDSPDELMQTTSPYGQRLLDSSEFKKLNVNNNNNYRHKSAVTLPRRVPPIFQEPEEEVKMAGGSLLGLPLSTQWRRYSSCTFLDFRELNTQCIDIFKDTSESKTKSLDDSSNALGHRSSDPNQDRKKLRRVKPKNDRSRDLEFKTNEVEGFRGDDDIDSLVKYIESSSLDGTKANKSRTIQSNETRHSAKIKSKEDESRSIKRRTKEKFQRCNSMEEISKSKLEDLTEEGSSDKINGSTPTLTKKKIILAEVGKKLSWRDLSKSTTQSCCGKKNEKKSQEEVQESEFHTVTKKQRKKNKRAFGGSRNEQVVPKPVFSAHDRTLEYRHRQESSIASQPRRKSASSVPPSDKSDSSDLDSVHSLPVSSTTTRTKVGKSSVSGGSTPQASYADIAKTLGSPPCSKASLMLPISSLLKKDATTDTNCDNPALEEYPPLDVKAVDFFMNISKKSECVKHRDNKKSEGKVILKTAPVQTVIPVPVETDSVPESLDVLSPCVKNLITCSNSKRPPVILVNEPTLGPQASELTFGFEINQQLLQCDNLVCNFNNSSSSTSDNNHPSTSQTTTTRDSSLDNIVYFINSAWESTMKDVEENRATYYEGQ